MKRPGVIRREEQLLRNVPDVLDYHSILYVGARPQRMQMLDLFRGAQYHIDILEVFPGNVIALEEMNKKTEIYDRIFLGDIRDIQNMFIDPADILMWWHGPEHVAKEELAPTLKIAETWAKRIVILACPFGAVAQGVCYGNSFEVHAAALYPPDFEILGYKTSTLGSPDKGGSNILAWKRMGQ